MVMMLMTQVGVTPCDDDDVRHRCEVHLVMMTMLMTQVRVTASDDDDVDDTGASYTW